MKKRDIIKLVKETIAKRRKKFYGQHDYYGNNVGGRSSISGMPGVWEENNNTIRVFRDKDLTILYSKDVPISDILKKGKDILVKDIEDAISIHLNLKQIEEKLISNNPTKEEMCELFNRTDKDRKDFWDFISIS